MPATLIQALKRAQARVTQLQAAVNASQTKELAGLPAKFGFSDVHEFAAAVVAANGGTSMRKIAAPSKASRKRKRAAITDGIRGEVKKLAEAGKTGAEIAAAVGISLPSVQNVKKALGLVQARKPARAAKSK